MLRILTASLFAAVALIGASPSLACDGQHAAADGQSKATLAANTPAAHADPAAKGAPVKNETKTDAVTGDAKHEPPKVTVDELSKLLEKNKKDATTVAVFDVNGDDLRKSKGSIPGAVLLPSAARFELTSLPAKKDSTLVFYCANEQCGASHTAAQRAIDAGYKNSKVLPAGIEGWVAAGKPTTKPPVG